MSHLEITIGLYILLFDSAISVWKYGFSIVYLDKNVTYEIDRIWKYMKQ